MVSSTAPTIRQRAELTQLVECQLPKLDVAGSNPVLRSFSFRFTVFLPSARTFATIRR